MVASSSSDEARVLVRELGCVADDLPAVEERGFSRSPEEVRGRVVALFGVVAAAHGLDRAVVLGWLEGVGCAEHLTRAELQNLRGRGPLVEDRGAVEALWVLAWALGLIPGIDWTQPCSDDFVRLFPDPRAGGDVAGFCSVPALALDQALQFELEVAFALHNCWVEHRLFGGVQPSSVGEGVVVWRRHGLEWLASTADWDDISLDT